MTHRPLPQLGDDSEAPFPPTRSALTTPNGLLAWGGGLEPGRLLRAYQGGIFPWFMEGQPPLWWSPAPRCVIFPGRLHLSRRTRRRIRQQRYQLTADTDFSAVIAGCATHPRGRGPQGAETWITPGMIEAYTTLHRAGHAHSIEVWHDDVLAGGLYGLAIGGIFFGESMFSAATDASKIALAGLCAHLEQHGYALLDCQVGNPHLYSLGAVDISREEFERILREHIHLPGGADPDAAHSGLVDASWRHRFSPGLTGETGA